MQRVLVFDGEKAARRFEMCRLAVLSAGDAKGDRSRETIRKEARLLDALDSVSEPSESDKDARTLKDKDARTLKAEGGTITLDQGDHALLAKYLDSTPWLPRASRDARDVQDWADAAEKVDG